MTYSVAARPGRPRARRAGCASVRFRCSGAKRMAGLASASASAGTGAGRVELVVACGEAVMDRTVLELGGPTAELPPVRARGRAARRLAVRRDGGARAIATRGASSSGVGRVFLVHHSHLDIGYTDLQARGAAPPPRLPRLGARPGGDRRWPTTPASAGRSRATCRCERWLASAGRGRRARSSSSLCASGRFEVCALPFTLNAEACSIDELARQLRLGADASRRARRRGRDGDADRRARAHGPACRGVLAAAGVRYLGGRAQLGCARRAVPDRRLRRCRALFHWGARRRATCSSGTPTARAASRTSRATCSGSPTRSTPPVELLPEYLAGARRRTATPTAASVEALGLSGGVEVPSRPYPLDVLHLRVQGADRRQRRARASRRRRSCARGTSVYAYPRLRLVDEPRVLRRGRGAARDVPRSRATGRAGGPTGSARPRARSASTAARRRSCGRRRRSHVARRRDRRASRPRGRRRADARLRKRSRCSTSTPGAPRFPGGDDAGRPLVGRAAVAVKASLRARGRGRRRALLAAAVAPARRVGAEPLRVAVV